MNFVSSIIVNDTPMHKAHLWGLAWAQVRRIQQGLGRNSCLGVSFALITMVTSELSSLNPYFTGSLGSMSSRGTLYKESQYVPSDVITW